MLEIIPISESERWNKWVRSVPEYDFYSLAEYHNLDRSGIPSLLYYADTETKNIILFPLIVRSIPGTDYKDITSVYGYAGPLSSKLPCEEVIHRFHGELKAFFDRENIVSAFARLHPLFPGRADLLNDLGEVRDSNPTVVIDLNQPYSRQLTHYSTTLRYDISRARKAGLTVRSAKNKGDIHRFIQIYYENMDRIDASDSYYFPEEYFFYFLEKINSRLLLAELNGEIIGGTLLAFCNRIVQCHLAATEAEYLKYSPVKCLWDEASCLGRSEGMRYLHLGGGYGGQNDSLFRFKSQFSKSCSMFQTWRYVHRPDVYSQLCEDRNPDETSPSSYFPLYRLGL